MYHVLTEAPNGTRVLMTYASMQVFEAEALNGAPRVKGYKVVFTTENYDTGKDHIVKLTTSERVANALAAIADGQNATDVLNKLAVNCALEGQIKGMAQELLAQGPLVSPHRYSRRTRGVIETFLNHWR